MARTDGWWLTGGGGWVLVGGWYDMYECEHIYCICMNKAELGDPEKTRGSVVHPNYAGAWHLGILSTIGTVVLHADA